MTGGVHEPATVLGQKAINVARVKMSNGNGAHTSHIHPLDQLHPEEIQETSDALRAMYPNESAIRFKFITAREPRKVELAPYLDATREESFQGSSQHVKPPRVASALFSKGLGDELKWVEALYDLDTHNVMSTNIVADEFKPQGDPEEVMELERILLADDRFQRRIADFKLPKGSQICADPWVYGSDTYDPIPRLVTYLVYYRLDSVHDPDTNHYSFPLPICPVIDSAQKKIVRIIECPTGGKGDAADAVTLDTKDPVAHFVQSEYMENLLVAPLRNDLKPLHISQPQGASFSVEGNRIKWQKWSFILSFNYREGAVLHDVHYDGRSVFYRLSLSEMTVPYGDPRPPYHRKQAFDAGDAGLGLCANELDLGCDCLGLIKYFSAVIAQPDGRPRQMKNVVCMHEVDDGILWKHTNYRTDNAAVVRSRHLVLQTICTVSNYEYIWIWKFDMAGAVHFETRATGILSTTYIDKGKTSAYGAIVAPGVLAANHQHAFCLRIDPAIEGHNNTALYEDSTSIPWGPENPTGVAWAVDQTIIKQEGGADACPASNRVFKMVNPNVRNPISGKPVGYKFAPHPGALLFAQKDSIAFKRAEFGRHHVYVTKYRDDELFASGNYTYQSCGNARGMESAMIAGKKVVEESDFVIWHAFCLTHNPRIEDWPVMPYESLTVSFKPADFFTQNPSIDAPRSAQTFNKSTAYEGLVEATDSTGCGCSKRDV